MTYARGLLTILPLPISTQLAILLRMNLVTLESVSHYYSERLLLDEVDLQINQGDRIGLLGRNGSGKTTLLRLIAGLEAPRNGRITVWGGVRVQYISQEPDLNENDTVLDTVFQSDAPHIKVLRQYEEISAHLHDNPSDPKIQAQFAKISDEMDHIGGWSAEADAKTILTKLGITRFDARINTLSGGQKKRVALANGLINQADLLILDEPTNHIDADTVAWLEQYLLTSPSAILMVTHDRYFLGRVVNKIIELDRRKLIVYAGNYGRYLEIRASREEQLQSSEAKHKSHLRRELEWLRRGAKARSTKQKARIQRIQEMQTITYDSGQQRVAVALAGHRLGKQVLEAQNLSKNYGDIHLFNQLDFQLNSGDRIGIIGPNGAGKSTFLDVLAQKTTPDSGQIHWGDTVKLGYYDQLSADLDDNEKVIDYINNIAPLIRSDDGRRIEAPQMLEWFLFTRLEQQAKIGSLSGGERRRLYLLRTLIPQPNVLFLDEPTNDLDIETLAVLEQFLDNFKGCLVVVSHDRYFLDRNVDFLLSFEDGVLGTRYPTPYETYRRLLAAEQQVKEPVKIKRETAVSPSPTIRKAKLNWKQKKELEALERQLPQLETEIANIETEINKAGRDYQKLQQWVTVLEGKKEELELAELRWLELSEIGEV